MVNMNLRKEFAIKLKILMEEKNISCYKLAKKLGITRQSISRYLNCERTITIDILIKIADYFNEDLNWLVGRDIY